MIQFHKGEVMAHAKLHIVCGNCGGTNFHFKIDPKGHDISDEVEEHEPAVFLHCRNCSTVHDLDDTAPMDKTRD